MYTTEVGDWVADDHDDDRDDGKKGEELREQGATLQIRRFQKRQVKVNYNDCEYLLTRTPV